MKDPIIASATSRSCTVRIEVTPAWGPLALDRFEAELDTNTEIARRNLRCAKLAHDAQLLATALYAQHTDTTLADAREDITESVVADLAADKLLASTLRLAGWRKDTPDPSPSRTYREGRGLIGGRMPEDMGKQRAYDVLVNVDNGMTIVAVAESAYDYHWEYPWRELPKPAPHTPWDYERVEPDAIASAPAAWWNTGKYTDGLDLGGGYWSASADSTKRADARRALTVPALPVDLDALLREMRHQ